ncbi:MAG TPA: TonB-dependent receptor plug domain-containing protein, partial [Pseudoxanthomonas sp.]|nr:TonB-dependent receptor plug domain-containing protein [Pseudoxanthomonas sp.]
MSSPSRFLAPKRSLLALMLLHVMTVQAQDAPAGDDPATPSAAAGDSTVSTTLSQVEVVGQATTYAKAVVTKEMLDRQSVMTSVNGVLNELPGVLVTEADTYGSSDWGTQISMRGFVSNRDTQQIGTTIDGLPNGGSGYGGGSRANRYLDILNLQTVEVSQGTADIASRSNEALGGTLNYVTDDPLDEQRLRFVVGAGEHQARKYYVRYDSGQWLGNTRAWVSASSAENRDWIDGSGKTTRDHLAGKFVTELGRWTVSGYLSWDEANESEYSSVSLAQYAIDPEHDSLTGTWTGIPYLDQQFRSGSRALRENTFGYLRGRFDGDRFKASVAAYGHRMEGRGDWIPPYLADVNADGAGNPESEFTGGTTNYGGPNLGRFYFVTPGGAAATMIAGCT